MDLLYVSYKWGIVRTFPHSLVQFLGRRSLIFVFISIIIAVLMYIVIAMIWNHMKTVQMTMEEDLIREVDRTAKSLGKTRSAFTREALLKAIQQFREKELEKKQIEGYRKNPVKSNEFSDWESEQVWVDR